jgi:hypothetical protein
MKTNRPTAPPNGTGDAWRCTKRADPGLWYHKRAGEILPAAKVLRWAQLEYRIYHGLWLQRAVHIPIIPAIQN